jgi:pyridoxamine 5'-phosphate oxidase
MSEVEDSNPNCLFEEWYQLARSCDAIKHPTAMCLSTASREGELNARIVDLKRFNEEGFVFTTYLSSPKGQEILENSAVALTFWWDALGRQVRVRGTAQVLNDKISDEFFAASRREAQLLVLGSSQSNNLSDKNSLESRIASIRDSYQGRNIERPDYWAAFLVTPIEMEFFKLEEDRIHRRICYVRSGDAWVKRLLQP